MDQFKLYVPTRIYFGTKITASAITAEAELLKGDVLLITCGDVLSLLGHTEALLSYISTVRTVERVVQFMQISENPKLHEVEECIEFGKREGVACVIGFGGGSAMDAAKAVAVGLGTNESLVEFLFNDKQPKTALPVILIPTTAGTGSELSQGAIITCAMRKKKSGIRGVKVYANAAIVDPIFTVSVPKMVTMDTGFDVIAHAIESYISKKSSAFSEMLSMNALRTASEALGKLVFDLNNIRAREAMSYASMIMGINLGNVGTALPHRMQYPIGALTDTSHAAGLAALYLAWIEYGYDCNQEKWNCIGTVINGVECSGKTDVLNEFSKLFGKLELCYSLSELGITSKDIDGLVEAITGDICADPAARFEGIIRAIYKKSL